MDRGVAGRHDHVHLALDQPGGENVDSPGLSLAERILDREVSPLDIAKLAQGAAPRLQVRFGELGGASPEHSDARHFVRRLRLDSKRRGEEAAREGRHEPPASKWIAERLASDRAGHRPPLPNARTGGSLAETNRGDHRTWPV